MSWAARPEPLGADFDLDAIAPGPAGPRRGSIRRRRILRILRSQAIPLLVESGRRSFEASDQSSFSMRIGRAPGRVKDGVGDCRRHADERDLAETLDA